MDVATRVRLRFTVTAGAWVRGEVRREIESEAWVRGLEIETEETKGILESLYRFVVRGERETVGAFMADVERWSDRINA